MGLSTTLEKSLNHYLGLSREAPVILSRLSGQVIALEIRPFSQKIFLCPNESSIQVLTEISGEPDVTIRGTPTALTRMGLGGVWEKSLAPGEIEILGKADTAHRLQALLRDLKIDWHPVLNSLTGSNSAATTLLDLLRSGSQWTRNTLDALQTDLSGYLREERHWLPCAPETDRFFTDVDTLRDQQERLKARIQRLETRLADDSDVDLSLNSP
jgi:ubiquinone biosynthesis protein UbiJ